MKTTMTFDSSCIAFWQPSAACSPTPSRKPDPSPELRSCRCTDGGLPVLSKFDDYPIHQTPDPIAHPASSDKDVYERYWFNGYSRSGDMYLGIGTAHIKLLSEGKDEASCIGTCARIKLFLTGFFVLVVLGAFFVQKHIQLQKAGCSKAILLV